MNPIIRLPLQLLSVGFLLLAVKIYAYFSTHSIAILSDVLESSVHLLAGALTIFSVWYARQPRDASHTPTATAKSNSFQPPLRDC